ncbi:MAG: flagellar motor switch protein FliN [Gammaproteobacteria bacterium]|nr:flagellar motor switch protein FliN [Gammaproteobacteria bacterium]
MSDEDTKSDQDLADEWAAALADQADVEVEAEPETEAAAEEAAEAAPAAPAPEATPASFDELKDTATPQLNEDANLEVILDIPVHVSMEIGRTRMPIRNLLQLNQGSVIELDRLAGEPMDVLVNGTLIAHGEVVVVNEKFGVRLTDIISPSERVKRLQ